MRKALAGKTVARLIQIEPVVLGDSDTARVGDRIFVIGRPDSGDRIDEKNRSLRGDNQFVLRDGTVSERKRNGSVTGLER